MVAIATCDRANAMWAHLWFGEPGFVQSDDGRIVTFALGRSVARDLAVGAPLGVLAIDLATRRRLRINGVVSSVTSTALALTVREAYPNCPKYIHRRTLVESSGTPASHAVDRGEALDDERRAFVANIDTMFVASRDPRRGLDVSHRGGPPGFVRVLDERTLRVPDYEGNGMFNTLGNFEVEPHAGLVLVDFVRGETLQLTGRVSLRFGEEDPTHDTGGTGRYWDLHVERWVHARGLALRAA